MSRVILPLPYNRPPLTMNDPGITRGAKFAKARLRKQIRADVCRLAVRAHLPRGVDHVVVQLHYQPPDNRTRDTDNLAPTLKPICDALTPGRPARISPRTNRKVPALLGYGMVRDDKPRWMTKPEPIIHRAVPGEAGRMWVELTWTTADTQSVQASA